MAIRVSLKGTEGEPESSPAGLDEVGDSARSFEVPVLQRELAADHHLSAVADLREVLTEPVAKNELLDHRSLEDVGDGGNLEAVHHHLQATERGLVEVHDVHDVLR